ncbi:hypothetical protein [Dokdonella sp.]|uniref:hypothetical protein n=1 Tax=Dokdonella sp. TaxID=2291710 RepID=UPI0025BF03BA|nr:hypothetical protein [Dokdonella sp.]
MRHDVSPDFGSNTPFMIPLMPAMRPFSQSSRTEESPINTPPASAGIHASNTMHLLPVQRKSDTNNRSW